MLLKDFREALLDRLLMFLWRQWSALGVLGASTTEEEWIIDPEPLLVFSLEIARYEPRLFDEILAWLVVNGESLDTARLRRILLKQDVRVVRVVGGALQWTADRKLIYERKWRKILDRCQDICEESPSDDVAEVLFKDRSGKFHPSAHGDSRDPSFALFHVNRPKINVQKEAKEVPINARANLRFPVRALFGSGAKAESILYLLTHEGGRPREIADSVGLFWLSVQQALFDLSRSGLVLTRTKGKKVEYWLSQKKWWEFLASTSPEDRALPKFLDWIAIFAAFSSLWNTAEEIAAGTESDYMKNSKLQDSMEVVAREFARSGYDPAYAPPSGLPPEMQRKMTLRYFDIIFDLRPELASTLR